MNNKPVRSILMVGLATSLCGPAGAQRQTYLTVSAFSYHLDRSREFNETNPGVGVEHFIAADLALVGGFYRNSRPSGEETSTYGGMAYTPFGYGFVRAGVMVGAVTGYKMASVLPAASAVVSIGGKQSGLNIQLIPSVHQRSLLGTVGLQLKRAF